ncbi:active breakpoint cluster region-related protein isoform X1 [Lingula anatina]|uniref:Active breakpoint cluster region-related protein isoform X1 n=1 Tax=Lingula anatina TaxID=7574 RepID=A0A1S3J866_LINAN|nr:active breakpoint cluster region-related protein isoform X1 [Lingula anatina]|eukprot:XP_013406426.1 active breakpoint cluster region-related protein isoform X1 [Lingula anatina]
MDLEKDFLYEWNEKFPDYEAPKLQCLVSQHDGASRKRVGIDSAKQKLDIKVELQNRKERLLELQLELSKETFLVEYLERSLEKVSKNDLVTRPSVMNKFGEHSESDFGSTRRPIAEVKGRIRRYHQYEEIHLPDEEDKPKEDMKTSDNNMDTGLPGARNYSDSSKSISSVTSDSADSSMGFSPHGDETQEDFIKRVKSKKKPPVPLPRKSLSFKDWRYPGEFEIRPDDSEFDTSDEHNLFDPDSHRHVRGNRSPLSPDLRCDTDQNKPLPYTSQSIDNTGSRTGRFDYKAGASPVNKDNSIDVIKHLTLGAVEADINITKEGGTLDLKTHFTEKKYQHRRERTESELSEQNNYIPDLPGRGTKFGMKEEKTQFRTPYENTDIDSMATRTRTLSDEGIYSEAVPVNEDGISEDEEEEPYYLNITELRQALLRRESTGSSDETSSSIASGDHLLHTEDVSDGGSSRGMSPTPEHAAGQARNSGLDSDDACLSVDSDNSPYEVGKRRTGHHVLTHIAYGNRKPLKPSGFNHPLPSTASPAVPDKSPVRRSISDTLPQSPNESFAKTNRPRASVFEINSPADHEKQRIRKWVVTGILDSETEYVECLEVLVQYMKSLTMAAKSSQPVISLEDINAIFQNLPEILKTHQDFVNQLKPVVETWTPDSCVGDIFKEAATYLPITGHYVQNYQKAVSTLNRCCQENVQFGELAKLIKTKQQKEKVSLGDLLFKPVNRLQRNTLVLHDLIHCTPPSHPDLMILQKALKLTQYFLENEDPMENEKDKMENQRFLVKNGLVVEKVHNDRKMRHLMLFNDVLVCAKQKLGARSRYHFEPKWFIPLSELKLAMKMDEAEKQSHDNKSVEMMKDKVKGLKKDLRKEIKRGSLEKDAQRSWSFRGNIRQVEKLKKKLAEQEAALVLAAPTLPLCLQHKKKTYTFLMSSDYERDEWKEAILCHKAKAGIVTLDLSENNIQALLESTRQLPKLNNASQAMLQEDMEDEVISGSLTVTIHRLQGLHGLSDTFCSMEVDTFGHFYPIAKTNTCNSSMEPEWNQTFEIDLEGSHTLRIMCYRQVDQEDELLGKSALELSKDWLIRGDFKEKTISINSTNELSLTVSIRYTSPQHTIKRRVSRIKTGLFGVRISDTCKREKRPLPLIVEACCREIERRGLDEMGIYRVSASTADVQTLKKAFERNSKAGSQLVSELDIHAVSGVLKLYFRELPEAVFTDRLYPSFVEGLDLTDPDGKQKCMLGLLASLPESNLNTILFLVKHLITVSKKDEVNKMTIHNLATVFGPTLLRPAVRDSTMSPLELLSMETKDAMLQTGILLYFLKLAQSGVDLSVKPSFETSF